MQKRAGYLTSKMRYQAVQLLAFLEDDFWLAAAKTANALARRLESAFSAHKDVAVLEKVETNQLFLKLSGELVGHLANESASGRRLDKATDKLFPVP